MFVIGLCVLLCTANFALVESAVESTFAHHNDRDISSAKQLFHILKRWGETKRPAYVNQFIVAVMLSPKELEESESWPEIPRYIKRLVDHEDPIVNNTRKVGRRMVYLGNLKKDKISTDGQELARGAWNGGRLHGEMWLIFGGYLKMIKENTEVDLQRTGEDINGAFLFIYSHYIPCARVDSVAGNFSCAQRVSQIPAQFNISVRVAYNEVFTARHAGLSTKKTLASKYMMDDKNGLYLFHMVYHGIQGQFEIVNFPAGAPGVPSKIIQQNLYACFMNLPSRHCCMDEENAEGVSSISVNHAVYNCTKERPNQHRLRIPELTTCLNEWVERHIGRDCPVCSDRSLPHTKAARALVKTCMDGALEFSEVIGSPAISYRRGITNPVWVHPRSPIYVEDPVNYFLSAPLFCALRTLDPIGLCTKTKGVGDRPPSERERNSPTQFRDRSLGYRVRQRGG